MNLARTIRFDGSDGNVFARAAKPGDWAIPGGFAFSNWTGDALTGKARQASSNGWLGLGAFGRSTFVAFARIEPAELESATERSPRISSRSMAPPRTRPRGASWRSCASFARNVVLTVARELTEAGVRESFRAISPADAEIDAVAVHGAAD